MSELIITFSEKIQPIDNSFDPASEQQVLLAEAEIGVRLPDFFSRIQLAYGRCMFSGEALVHVNNSTPLGIFTIFGCKGNSGNLVSDFKNHPDFQARKHIPIADDMFNNRFAWDAVTGNVLFYDYVDQKAPAIVAATFEEFISCIQIIPD